MRSIALVVYHRRAAAVLERFVFNIDEFPFPHKLVRGGDGGDDWADLHAALLTGRGGSGADEYIHFSDVDEQYQSALRKIGLVAARLAGLPPDDELTWGVTIEYYDQGLRPTVGARVRRCAPGADGWQEGDWKCKEVPENDPNVKIELVGTARATEYQVVIVAEETPYKLELVREEAAQLALGREDEDMDNTASSDSGEQ